MKRIGTISFNRGIINNAFEKYVTSKQLIASRRELLLPTPSFHTQQESQAIPYELVAERIGFNNLFPFPNEQDALFINQAFELCRVSNPEKRLALPAPVSTVLRSNSTQPLPARDPSLTWISSPQSTKAFNCIFSDGCGKNYLITFSENDSCIPIELKNGIISGEKWTNPHYPKVVSAFSSGTDYLIVFDVMEAYETDTYRQKIVFNYVLVWLRLDDKTKKLDCFCTKRVTSNQQVKFCRFVYSPITQPDQIHQLGIIFGIQGIPPCEYEEFKKLQLNKKLPQTAIESSAIYGLLDDERELDFELPTMDDGDVDEELIELIRKRFREKPSETEPSVGDEVCYDAKKPKGDSELLVQTFTVDSISQSEFCCYYFPLPFSSQQLHAAEIFECSHYISFDTYSYLFHDFGVDMNELFVGVRYNHDCAIISVSFFESPSIPLNHKHIAHFEGLSYIFDGKHALYRPILFDKRASRGVVVLCEHTRWCFFYQCPKKQKDCMSTEERKAIEISEHQVVEFYRSNTMNTEEENSDDIFGVCRLEDSLFLLGKSLIISLGLK